MAKKKNIQQEEYPSSEGVGIALDSQSDAQLDSVEVVEGKSIDKPVEISEPIKKFYGDEQAAHIASTMIFSHIAVATGASDEKALKRACILGHKFANYLSKFNPENEQL